MGGVAIVERDAAAIPTLLKEIRDVGSLALMPDRPRPVRLHRALDSEARSQRCSIRAASFLANPLPAAYPTVTVRIGSAPALQGEDHPPTSPTRSRRWVAAAALLAGRGGALRCVQTKYFRGIYARLLLQSLGLPFRLVQ
jgi:hypothetical protein